MTSDKMLTLQLETLLINVLSVYCMNGEHTTTQGIQSTSSMQSSTLIQLIIHSKQQRTNNMYPSALDANEQSLSVNATGQLFTQMNRHLPHNKGMHEC